MFRKLEDVRTAGKSAEVIIDGIEVMAEAGEPIAAVLLRTAPFTTRNTPVTGAPRAPYCMMGACFDCLATIDGVTSVRSCMTRARDGMVITRQEKRPDPLAGDVP